jgi:outer membrane receptor protein involved in Fe transport
MRDVGSLANDLKLAGDFELGGATLTTRAGFFYMKQDIAMDWHVNKSTREVSGDNPAQLDLFDAAGNQLTNEGVSGYNNNWGNCCAREYDLSYTNTAPYAGLDLEAGPFVLDGSIRFERVKAKGSGRSNVISPELTRSDSTVIPEVAGPTVNQVVNGVTIPSILANGTIERLNYTRSYKSWTVGGLFKASDDLSLFARASRGGRFNGDRQTFGNKIRSDGKLCTAADQAATQAAIDAGGTAMVAGCKIDGVTPSVDFVSQYEIGLKTRGNIGAGRFTAELSLLKADFKQSTFELSATRCPSTGGTGGGCIIDAQYKSSGAEFFGTYQNGGFMFVANATYSNSKQKGGGAAAYRRASYLPDLTYTMSASYDFDDLVTLGLAATGQTGVRDDPGNVYPGGLILNGNIAVRPIKNLELGLQAYNLFNRLDFRGNGSNVADASVNPIVVTGTPVVGRTLSASVRYNF